MQVCLTFFLKKKKRKKSRQRRQMNGPTTKIHKPPLPDVHDRALVALQPIAGNIGAAMRPAKNVWTVCDGLNNDSKDLRVEP